MITVTIPYNRGDEPAGLDFERYRELVDEQIMLTVSSDDVEIVWDLHDASGYCGDIDVYSDNDDDDDNIIAALRRIPNAIWDEYGDSEILFP